MVQGESCQGSGAVGRQPYAGLLAKNKAARQFFDTQPPGYRKVIGWYIVSAKRQETRLGRLKKLIDASAKGQRLG